MYEGPPGQGGAPCLIKIGRKQIPGEIPRICGSGSQTKAAAFFDNGQQGQRLFPETQQADCSRVHGCLQMGRCEREQHMEQGAVYL